ncbi:hypothetical protein [Corynebacterium hindlerae]|uniref:hypothetical protein n=1 Tax=Corynebacterium hindlerae TaxID=699041 RepID=UPI0031B70323
MKRSTWFVGASAAIALVVVAGFVDVSLRQSPFETAISKSDHIVLSEVSKKKIDKAYVICPYAEQESFTKLGFHEKDIYSIRNNSQAWETHSGLALKYDSGDTDVVYFRPTKIDACPGKLAGNPPEVDPNATIRVDEVTKKFANPDREATVRVLRY